MASGPAGWLRKGSAPKREEGREQRKERREKREETREERKLPQARLTAFLQGPVATSLKANKSKKSFEVGHLFEKSRFENRGGSRARITAF